MLINQFYNIADANVLQAIEEISASFACPDITTRITEDRLQIVYPVVAMSTQNFVTQNRVCVFINNC